MMYADELSDAYIEFEKIFLDANNPRFWEKSSTRNIPDAKITENKIQLKVEEKISNYGIEDLRLNILRNGFLPLDRIVVRKLNNYDDNYVVIEGNRRIAALRILRKCIEDDVIDEEGIDEDHLKK